MEKKIKRKYGQGDITKGETRKYRNRWSSSVKEHHKKHKDHPYHLGIHMDTHHLISEEAINIAGSEIQDLLIDKGFDINNIKNLVGLPSSLKGACHLGIQVHRGDHTFVDPNAEIEYPPYHDFVKKRLRKRKAAIKKCYGLTDTDESADDIHFDVTDPLSDNILSLIALFLLPLSSIYNNFEKKTHDYSGCCDCIDIPTAYESEDICTKKGDHLGEIDYRYIPESKHSGNKLKVPIKYQGEWTLRVGL